MRHRTPIHFDETLLDRSLDPHHRDVLADDWPHYWRSGLLGIELLSRAVVLSAGQFDRLEDANRRIVATLVARTLEVLNRQYVRRLPAMSEFLRSILPIAYVAFDELWIQIDRSHWDRWTYDCQGFIDALKQTGMLVRGDELEGLHAHADEFVETRSGFARLRPRLNEANLDSDPVHQFLCAYDTCFPNLA